MTGVIICENCNEIFFAHGSRNVLPNYIKEIPSFTGIRIIKSKEVRLSSYTETTIPIFKDYCSKCVYKLKKGELLIK